jgi:glycosyl-4,4'-diaponeurosporenoate acyltransferase
MDFLYCFIYLAIIGTITFFVGRILPKSWFNYDCFPYKCFEWEDGGKIYDKIKIKKWQNKLPDMSKIFKKLMPAKKIVSIKHERIELMIKETCIAEAAHLALMIMGFGCASIWEGKGGVVISIVYFIVNIPFVLIQRYNRPRLRRILRQPQEDGNKKAALSKESIGG